MTKLPIKRANINGKRRFAIYLSDLINHLQNDIDCRESLTTHLQGLIKKGRLRVNIDWTYNQKYQDTALTIASTQILLATYAQLYDTEQPQRATQTKKTDTVYDVIHHTIDFLQGLNT